MSKYVTWLTYEHSYFSQIQVSYSLSCPNFVLIRGIRLARKLVGVDFSEVFLLCLDFSGLRDCLLCFQKSTFSSFVDNLKS